MSIYFTCTLKGKTTKKTFLFHDLSRLCPILEKKREVGGCEGGAGGSQTSLFIFILILNYLYQAILEKKNFVGCIVK